MTPTPHLHPTTTQRLREFLREEGREPPPWSTLEEVMDRLREVLHSKHSDPAVWKELATLIGDLQGHANGTDRLAASEAEVLSPSDIADIVRELKAAVGKDAAKKGNGLSRQFFAERTAATMACLTLLGLAFQTACSSSSDEPRVPQTGGSAGVANNGGTGGNEAGGAEAGSGGAEAGSGGAVDDASSDPVTDAFQLDSPNEIADALQELINAGGSAGGGTGGSGGAYKGIMFDEIT